MIFSRSMVLSLAIVITGLAGKAVVDKALALQGGPEAVGLWGQIGSLSGLISGVSLSGLGAGLVVATARAVDHGERLALLVAALLLSLLSSGLFFLPLFFWPQGAEQLSGASLAPLLILLTGCSGWLEVIPGMVTAAWQGAQRRGFILGLVWAGALASLLVIFLPMDQPLMIRLLLGQIGFALLVGVGVLVYGARRAGWRHRLALAWKPLLGYLPAGLSIGILSPLSSLLLRTSLATALSWGDMGLIQAQWRMTDWMTTIASGVMGFYYLPRLSNATDGRAFAALTRSMILATFWPSGLMLLFFFLWRHPLTHFFYLDGFPLPPLASLFFLLGDWLRVYAWIWLNALFARGQTMAVAIGELFSLPLYATLLWLFRPHLTPELAGLLWLTSYGCYAAFNRYALKKPA